MTDQLRRESLEAIRRSGRVLEQAAQERRRIRATLARSEAIDRDRSRGIVRRVVSRV